ncbi:hypothetical protein [Streptomyces hoynatensis]|uniref:Uncharacterized protein n=1 Tax=Streptomyces hoynatensis TaxID=1141874 RepID=A0A3A9ZAX8_9ACTN|nr:hypothetical protein [Streptomyces hoynatensis]RKN45612.1 hypothetical protein D7294_03825 [Streptomyces hoynatensis]
MGHDGLYYLPEGFRGSARLSGQTADAAESTRHYLGRATPDPGSYAGATEFVSAVTGTRDTQARGVAKAAEGRENMAAASSYVAATGEEMDGAAHTVVGAVTVTPVSRQVADGI